MSRDTKVISTPVPPARSSDGLLRADYAPDELAILGARPAFMRPLHVGLPNIGDRAKLMARIEGILDSRWLTNRGPLVREFEDRLCDYTGARHAISMCNATVALEIVTRALGMSGEVIVPSMTFIATAHALQWQQVTPVFCDIDPATHNLDPARVESMITSRTTGIVGVHLWGRPCDVDALEDIAKRHELSLVFDAAHALGCSYRGRMIGGFGDAEVFSFHATKILNSFEGGAVVTNDDALAEKIRLMQNFGFADLDNVVHVGTNGKMSEISAAMGLTSLESLDEFVARSRENHSLYRKQLARIPGLALVEYDDRERCNYQYIVVNVDEGRTRLSRDRLVDVLRAENVLARRYFWPGCHRMEPYRSMYPHAHLQLPETERLVRRLMVLPTGTTIGEAEISAVCAILACAVRKAAEIDRRGQGA
jgi:dTDP-4-amino-4,6-dideoxygalactose transaminase